MQQPGQAAPPGQGPMQPGMAPQQGAQTPGGVTGGLSKLPPEQLLAMYNNPQDTTPKLSVAGAYAQAVEQQRLLQMAAGQTAMAQNAQQQQQMPVVQELMSQPQQPEPPAQEPVMAAFGGLMRGYAGGGAVAFRYGGDVQKFSGGADEFGVLANPEAEAMDALRVERAQKEKQLKALEETYYSLMMQNDPRAAQVKQQLDALSGRAPMSSPAVSSAPTRQGKSGIADLDIGPSMAPSQRTGASAAAQQLGSGQSQQRQKAAPAPVQSTVANPATAASPVDLSPEMAKALADREAQMRGRLVRPESLVAAEQGLAALAKSNIEAQQTEAKTFGDEARAARDAALARSQRNILNDPMSLLALAGSIDTRRGQGVGSLARGAAGLMGERERQAEAARKEFALAQRDERAMQANIRQTQMLEAQRQVALEQGKLAEVNAINDQLSNLAMEREKFRITRGDKAFEQAMEGRRLAVEERKAKAAEISAGKPSELEQRIRLFQQNPEQYRTMYGIDPKETSVELRALKDEEQQLLKRLEATMLPDARQPIESRLDEIIRMRRTLMGAAPTPATAAGGAVDRNNPLLK